MDFFQTGKKNPIHINNITFLLTYYELIRVAQAINYISKKIIKKLIAYENSFSGLEFESVNKNNYLLAEISSTQWIPIQQRIKDPLNDNYNKNIHVVSATKNSLYIMHKNPQYTSFSLREEFSENNVYKILCEYTEPFGLRQKNLDLNIIQEWFCNTLLPKQIYYNLQFSLYTKIFKSNFKRYRCFLKNYNAQDYLTLPKKINKEYFSDYKKYIKRLKKTL